MGDHNVPFDAGSRPRIDPLARRQILASVSNPACLVPGIVLLHLENHASSASISRWLNNGWIKLVGTKYVLTEEGVAALTVSSPPPPDSYFPGGLELK